MSTRETAQLAGLRTSKLIATEPWPCPETCRERGGDLLWKGSQTINAELSRTEDLALRFATLCSADTPAIVRFARRFGPLYLCEHRLPMTHIPEHAYRYMLDELPLAFPGRSSPHAVASMAIANPLESSFLVVMNMSAPLENFV